MVCCHVCLPKESNASFPGKKGFGRGGGGVGLDDDVDKGKEGKKRLVSSIPPPPPPPPPPTLPLRNLILQSLSEGPPTNKAKGQNVI